MRYCERIDELWTAGELNIGYANIASKHWLPDLYERNDYQLLWQNPQNVTDLLTDIGRVAEEGLNPEDYHLELAELLLDDPDKWNRQSIQKLLDTNKTRRVNLPKPKPVMLMYVTVWFDENDNFIFKRDVYERDPAVLEGLKEGFSIWQTRAIK